MKPINFLQPRLVFFMLFASATLAPKNNAVASDSLKFAGFRASGILSSYPNRQFPAPEYWTSVGQKMAEKFTSHQPAGVWIVSLYLSDPEGSTLLNFPSPGGRYDRVYFKSTDENEAHLDYFDAHGLRIFLQVEPGGAKIDTLIHLVLARYRHHACVIGFGIDVEWYETYNYPGGRRVTDREAERWEQKVQSFNPEYQLFLKHYGQDWMPAKYRGKILFIDDSQDFTWAARPLNGMVSEFKAWGEKFKPNPVGFQYGYSIDRSWWDDFADPAKSIGDALLANISNCVGLFWVDFTITELFPVDVGDLAGGSPLARFQLQQNFPNPFNGTTQIPYSLENDTDVGLTIYNLLGQVVFRAFWPNQRAGEYLYALGAENLPSGTYVYQLATNAACLSKKMTLLK
jgi:hypothetical protein